MSELLEVDYGGEDIQHESKNQHLKIDPDKEEQIGAENDVVKIPVEKELQTFEPIEKKIKGKLSKDPIFFVLRLSEEILSSSLSTNSFIISDDVFRSNQKYFEV